MSVLAASVAAKRSGTAANAAVQKPVSAEVKESPPVAPKVIEGSKKICVTQVSDQYENTFKTKYSELIKKGVPPKVALNQAMTAADGELATTLKGCENEKDKKACKEAVDTIKERCVYKQALDICGGDTWDAAKLTAQVITPSSKKLYGMPPHTVFMGILRRQVCEGKSIEECKARLAVLKNKDTLTGAEKTEVKVLKLILGDTFIKKVTKAVAILKGICGALGSAILSLLGGANLAQSVQARGGKEESEKDDKPEKKHDQVDPINKGAVKKNAFEAGNKAPVS